MILTWNMRDTATEPVGTKVRPVGGSREAWGTFTNPADAVTEEPNRKSPGEW